MPRRGNADWEGGGQGGLLPCPYGSNVRLINNKFLK